jgi:hypothetical protein
MAINAPVLRETNSPKAIKELNDFNGKMAKQTNKNTSDIGNVPLATQRQDNTTNKTVSNQLIQTGWGYVLGNGTAFFTEAVTFPVAFDDRPIVVATLSGYKSGANPTHQGDCSSYGEVDSMHVVGTSTTGFTACFNFGGAVANTIRILYQWIAIGTKAR